MKKNKKIRIIVLGLLTMVAIYLFFWTYSKNYLSYFFKKNNIDIVNVKGFKVVEEKETEGVKVFVAKKDDQKIVAKVYFNVQQRESDELVEAQKINISNIYTEGLYPYPEFLNRTVSCKKEYKPVKRDFLEGEYYLFFVDERFNYGACSKENIKYKALRAEVYLQDEKKHVSIEWFFPLNKEFSEVEEKFSLIDESSKYGEDSGKNKVEIYSVSACPFTRDLVHALVSFLKYSSKEVVENIEVNINYYGKEYSRGEFISYHGPEEPKLNILELCIIDKYPDNLEYLYIIDCLNQRVNLTNADESIVDLMNNWEECTNDVKVNKDKEVEECASSEEGKNLYRKSIAYILEDEDAKFPPMLKLNDVRFPTIRSDAFRLELCKKGEGNILECSDLPECFSEVNCENRENQTAFCINNKCEYGEKLKMIIIKDNSRDNEGYFSNYAIEWYSLLLGEFDVQYIDVNSAEGIALIEGLGLKEFPTILISEEVEKTGNFRERFGYTRLIFSKKIKDWYMVDHERFDYTNMIIETDITSAEGIHFKDRGLDVSDELKDYFKEHSEFYEESKEYYNENFL